MKDLKINYYRKRKQWGVIKAVCFKLVKWLIFRYFSDGLTPEYGLITGKIIGWKWVFKEQKYKKIYKKECEKERKAMIERRKGMKT